MSKSILIADGENQAATKLYEFLSAKQFKVFVASSGRETIDALHNYLVDALILDTVTPLMPPTDFLLKIRQMKFRVPCFLIGNKPLTKAPSFHAQLGAYTQIEKPIDLPRLANDLRIVTKWDEPGGLNSLRIENKARKG